MKLEETLFPNLKQLEVDFVIPRQVEDLPLCVDPFLLYKSRDPELRRLHDLVVRHFGAGVEAVKLGNIEEAERILDFPEVPEVGFGYGSKDKRGSGLGTILQKLLIDSLTMSPAIMARGVRHIEEMQLISPGIGPDRVGDIASNILKGYLIEYTQRQCAIHNIPVEQNVPLEHVFDPDDGVWQDGYFDLPRNPKDGKGVLLVPRRMVRQLPWINYENFAKTEFRAYLAAKTLTSRSRGIGSPSKTEVTSISRIQTSLIDSYVKQRERLAAEAQPFLPPIRDDSKATGEALLARLQQIPIGQAYATTYQRAVLDILTFVFCPDLIDGRLEERTIEGTERRDILFTNDSDDSFFDYVRQTHDALVMMFEAKNVSELTMAALNQSATYLGDRIGRLGFIVTRHSPGENVVRKQITIFNDSQPRKVLLVLTDSDLAELVKIRAADGAPTKWLQRHYRNFRTAVQ
ncbi:MAG: hypothetical protein ABSG62_14065 [Terracidiphilus sp.]|jgi:hypothetical protein